MVCSIIYYYIEYCRYAVIYGIQVNNLPVLDMFINPDKKPILKAKENAMKRLIQHYISDEMNKEIFNKVVITLLCVKAKIIGTRNQYILYHFKIKTD